MSKLSVYYVNATSLAKPNAIQLLSTDISTNNIHVVLVAETWFDHKVPDDLASIDNYTLFRLDRNPKQKRKGGGICFYVRNDVKYSIIKHRNLSEPNLEYMFISCEFASTSYVIACIYHPPKPYYDTGLLVYELSADLDNLLNANCDSVFILAGDFNHLNTEFLSTDFGFHQLVTTATHGNNLIDKVFVSHPDIYQCTVIKSLLKTKHRAVILFPLTPIPCLQCCLVVAKCLFLICENPTYINFVMLLVLMIGIRCSAM